MVKIADHDQSAPVRSAGSLCALKVTAISWTSVIWSAERSASVLNDADESAIFACHYVFVLFSAKYLHREQIRRGFHSSHYCQRKPGQLPHADFLQ